MPRNRFINKTFYQMAWFQVSSDMQNQYHTHSVQVLNMIGVKTVCHQTLKDSRKPLNST